MDSADGDDSSPTDRSDGECRFCACYAFDPDYLGRCTTRRTNSDELCGHYESEHRWA